MVSIKINQKYILLGLAIILTWWLMKYVFVNDQDLIKSRLNLIADQASFKNTNSHPFEKLRQAKEMAANFTDQVKLTFVTHIGKKEKIYRQEELIKFMTLARNYLDRLKVKFRDVTIQMINPKTAEVRLTAVAEIEEKGSSEDVIYAQEMQIEFQKLGSEWLLSQGEALELLEKN